jgi:hypothetical protein
MVKSKNKNHAAFFLSFYMTKMERENNYVSVIAFDLCTRTT